MHGPLSVDYGVAHSTSRDQGLVFDGLVVDDQSDDRTATEENIKFLQLEIMNSHKEKARFKQQVKTNESN